MTAAITRRPPGVLLTFPDKKRELQFENQLSLCVSPRKPPGAYKRKKCFVCVSFMEVAVDPVCLGVLSDCLTDNPSRSQSV